MSSALTNRICWRAGTRCYRASSEKPCATLPTAARPLSAGASNNAVSADIASSYITHVVIITAPSARQRRVPAGWHNARRSCYRFPISMSCSHSPPRSADWLFRTRNRSTPSYFGLPRTHCLKRPPIPDCWARPSASSLCCTPGGRICICIRTYIASCRAEESPWMARAGSDAANRPSFCRCVCSAAASENPFCDLSDELSGRARSASAVNWHLYQMRLPSRPGVKKPVRPTGWFTSSLPSVDPAAYSNTWRATPTAWQSPTIGYALWRTDE